MFCYLFKLSILKLYWIALNWIYKKICRLSVNEPALLLQDADFLN